MSSTVTLLAINDVYQLDNLTYFASCKEEHERELNEMGIHNGCIGLLAGDFVSPSLLSTVDYGQSMVDCLNKCGLNYCSLGNHENDIPYAQLLLRIQESQFSWISSNLNIPGTYHHYIHTVKCGDIERKILFLGFLTEDPFIYNHHSFNDIPIYPVLATILHQIHLLKHEFPDIDLIIPMTHQDISFDRELLKTGLFPLILGGHDHESYLETNSQGHILLKTGFNAENIGICKINWLDNESLPTIDVELVPCKQYPKHPQITHTIQEYQRLIEKMSMAPLFSITPEPFPLFPWNEVSSYDCRRYSTTLTTILCTDLRDATGADCCLINAGSFRGNRSYSKEIFFTLAHLYSELPLPTPITIIKLPGSVLQNTIMFSRLDSLKFIPKTHYLHSDNKLIWDTTSQVIKEINGKAFSLDTEYSIAINSKLLEGMDSITPLLSYQFLSYNTYIPHAVISKDAKDILLYHWGKTNCGEDSF